MAAAHERTAAVDEASLLCAVFEGFARDLVVVGEDPVRLQPLVPGEGEPLLGALEVVLDVALAADVCAHLLAGGHLVDVVVRHAVGGLHLGDGLHERRPGDPQRHGLRVVAVDAGDRVLHGLANLGIGHVRVADDVEAFHQVGVAEFEVGGDDRCVAVDAHGRGRKLLALGEGLVVEHVGVAAALAIILLIFAAVAGPAWFERDKTGFTSPALDEGVLGAVELRANRPPFRPVEQEVVALRHHQLDPFEGRAEALHELEISTNSPLSS